MATLQFLCVLLLYVQYFFLVKDLKGSLLFQIN